MSQPYVGEIRIFAGNFAPVGWMFCEGQLLSISENETLFQLIGTTYGGDGESTFALPDLRGRIPIHMGNGFTLAETGGAEEVWLTTAQIPSHDHGLGNPSGDPKLFGRALGAGTGGSPDPKNSYATMVPGLQQYGTVKSTAVNSNSANLVDKITTKQTGGSQPHSNFQPYLCVNFIISLFGVFPSST